MFMFVLTFLHMVCFCTHTLRVISLAHLYQLNSIASDFLLFTATAATAATLLFYYLTITGKEMMR